ncbi:hypothetical protein ABBQ38_006771 [Trebouxia sp. C0009 RCD-2024]
MLVIDIAISTTEMKKRAAWGGAEQQALMQQIEGLWPQRQGPLLIAPSFPIPPQHKLNAPPVYQSLSHQGQTQQGSVAAPHSTHPPLPRSTPEHPLPHACDYHTPIHNPLAPTLTHTVINVISFQGLLHGPTIQLRLEAVTGPWPQLKISTAASLAYGMQPTGLALHVVPQVGSCSSRTAAAVD